MTRPHRKTRLLKPLAAAALLLAAGLAQAATETFQGMTVEVVGTGRPVLMIPGLNSGAETWRETCAALQDAKIQCHLVNLPGFAGVPAVAADPFLPDMRDRLLAYARARQLDRPAVVGHSLGGVLALQMAIAAPEAVGPMVIVDSLPFFAAVMNPAATPATARPMAEGMRQQMRASDEATYLQGLDANLGGMTQSADRLELLKRWGRASDRGTTSQAMFDMMQFDLRDDLARVRAPTLVLGAWAAYAPLGSTKESTRNIFATQYAKLEGVRIEMSEGGYHFLMWDDPTWLQSHLRTFLAAHRAP